MIFAIHFDFRVAVSLLLAAVIAPSWAEAGEAALSAPSPEIAIPAHGQRFHAATSSRSSFRTRAHATEFRSTEPFQQGTLSAQPVRPIILDAVMYLAYFGRGRRMGVRSDRKTGLHPPYQAYPGMRELGVVDARTDLLRYY